MSVMASQITSLTIVYSAVYSSADQRKRQSSASLAFLRVNSLHNRPVTRKMFPLDDVIMDLRTWNHICLFFKYQYIREVILKLVKKWSGQKSEWRPLYCTQLKWYGFPFAPNSLISMPPESSVQILGRFVFENLIVGFHLDGHKSTSRYHLNWKLFPIK